MKAAFIDMELASIIDAQTQGTCYVYSENILRDQIAKIKQAIPAGTTVRYAMKANNLPAILNIITDQGVHIDASSGYEVLHALKVGISPDRIQLTTQEFPEFLEDEFRQGVQFVACSLYQLERFGQKFPGSSLGIRCNPGVGSGQYAKVNTGGVESSFGIWHEYLPQAKEIAQTYNLHITKLHTHIGSGTDPVAWMGVAHLSCEIAQQLPEVITINLGGGFKIKRYAHEKEADMKEIFKVIEDVRVQCEAKTGRKYALEIEPGTFIVGNAGAILCHVGDIVDTGEEGYHFLKLTTGMDAILRPTMYGAQHTITVLTDEHEMQEYVVVGHCCESGDLLTPEVGNPEQLATRNLPKAKRGDAVVIDGCGAYCTSMSAKGYNSFPPLAEILVRSTGKIERL